MLKGRFPCFEFWEEFFSTQAEMVHLHSGLWGQMFQSIRIYFRLRILMPPRMKFTDWLLSKNLLCNKVWLVANQDNLNVLMGVVFDFEEPLVNIFERGSPCYVKYKKSCNRSFVIRPSDRFKGLLSCLI